MIILLIFNSLLSVVKSDLLVLCSYFTYIYVLLVMFTNNVLLIKKSLDDIEIHFMIKIYNLYVFI